jgi:hypothetical protein
MTQIQITDGLSTNILDDKINSVQLNELEIKLPKFLAKLFKRPEVATSFKLIISTATHSFQTRKMVNKDYDRFAKWIGNNPQNLISVNGKIYPPIKKTSKISRIMDLFRRCA